MAKDDKKFKAALLAMPADQMVEAIRAALVDVRPNLVSAQDVAKAAGFEKEAMRYELLVLELDAIAAAVDAGRFFEMSARAAVLLEELDAIDLAVAATVAKGGA